MKLRPVTAHKEDLHENEEAAGKRARSWDDDPGSKHQIGRVIAVWTGRTNLHRKDEGWCRSRQRVHNSISSHGTLSAHMRVTVAYCILSEIHSHWKSESSRAGARPSYFPWPFELEHGWKA